MTNPFMGSWDAPFARRPSSGSRTMISPGTERGAGGGTGPPGFVEKSKQNGNLAAEP